MGWRQLLCLCVFYNDGLKAVPLQRTELMCSSPQAEIFQLTQNYSICIQAFKICSSET